MNWGQLLPALVWLGVGAAMAAGAYQLGIGALNNPGPGLFAFVIGIAMAALSLSVAATSWSATPASEVAGVPRRAGPAIGVIAALIFYSLALERIGFALCTFLFLAFLLSVLGRSSWLTALAASASITAGSYLIFAKLLKINLPNGPLGF
jgi:putative tricarboxylic transport membrane protein